MAHGERPADITTLETLSINKFSEQKELPPSVFRRRLKELGSNPTVQSAEIKGGKRCSSGRGKRPIVPYETQNFIVDVIVRRDGANDGMTRGDIAEMMGLLLPNVSSEQCADAFRKMKRSERFQGRLSGVVLAQKTTTKRSAIKIAPQFRRRKARRYSAEHNIHHKPHSQLVLQPSSLIYWLPPLVEGPLGSGAGRSHAF